MLCCKENTLGDRGGACPISISGVEVGEVMGGQGTTYGFTLSVLLHIALCICVRGCLTWLGTILQMGLEMGFQTWFGFVVHPVRHASILWQHCSDCFCLLCCVVCCFGGIKPPRGGFITPKLGWFYHPEGAGFNKGGGFIPQKGSLYPPKGVVLSPKWGGCIPLKSGHKSTWGGFKGCLIPYLGVVLCPGPGFLHTKNVQVQKKYALETIPIASCC